MINQIRNFYLPDRVAQLDPDFLEFEEEMATQADLSSVHKLLSRNSPAQSKFNNTHNSCILYATGISDEFDFGKGRADTRGGSPPDIDIDFDALERQKAIQWVTDKWGAERVCYIITHGTFKPKSVTRNWFRVTEGDDALKREILKLIPKPVHGKEPKMKDVLAAAPELATEAKYADWLKAALHLEGMTNKFGIHAAGLVISDFPITDLLPIWAKKEKILQADGTKKEITKRIAQFDMHEVEELGLIKFDFLGIDNLSVIKEAVRLVQKHHGVQIDVDEIPDGDTRTYTMLQQGLLTGIFQFETSGTARDLIAKVAPTNIEQLSDISALNRPGPMQAGLDEMYVVNRNAGYDTRSLPADLSKLLEGTFWTLVYQEQCMFIASELAGFTLTRADDLRRAIGKKKAELMAKFEVEFVEGLIQHSTLDEYQANALWQELVGFAAYGFNKSHSVAYSKVTYQCAWLKANYTAEFFCALMTVRSNTLQPKDWGAKAPQYIREAGTMGVNILPPSVNASDIGFHIENGNVYFGFNAIRDVGKTAARSVMQTRGKTRFASLEDFINRCNLSKVNTKVFTALVASGAFDRMGYARQELMDNMIPIYAYTRDFLAWKERAREIPIRDRDNAKKTKLIEKRDALRKELKAAQRKLKLKKTPEADKPGLQFLADETEVKLLDFDDMDLKRKPALKAKDEPIFPTLARSSEVTINLLQLMTQAHYIGCYIGTHPADIIYPDAVNIAYVCEGESQAMAGAITKVKEIVTRKGDKMAFIELADATASAELVVFPKVYRKLLEAGQVPEQGDIVRAFGKIEATDPITKAICYSLERYEISGADK